MAALREGNVNFQLSKDEAEKLSNALKDEKFRSLLAEYAEEITDPQNRALYEKEIAELEKERGVEVTFINPEPCYVLKTIVNGEKKAFLNICSNTNVNKATCQRAVEENDTRGYRWSIPYSLAPPKEDLDKEKRRCVVYDVVFHPDTLYMGKKNPRFKKLIEDTAMEGIEKNFKVTLDRKNIKYPKMKFKGLPVGTVIRKIGEEGLKTPKSLTDTFTIPYPDINMKLDTDKSNEEASKSKNNIHDIKKENNTNNSDSQTPKYVIKHRNHFDIEDFAYDNFGGPSVKNNIPSELNVEIELPLLQSANQIDLDVNERTLRLKSLSAVKYNLEIDLPYQVDSDKSNAKFDISTHKLCVILPVKAENYAIDGTEEMTGDNVASKENTSDNSPHDLYQIDSAAVSDVHDNMIPNRTTNDNLCEVTESILINCENEDILSQNPMIAYLLPAYEPHQSDNKLVLVLHVSNVDPTSVVKKISDDRQTCTVSFVTLGSGFVPFHYKICIKAFDDKCFDIDSASIDVEEINTVLILTKNDSSEWKQIYVGLDEDHLQETNLLTMNSVEEKMKELQLKYEEYSTDAEKLDNTRVMVNCLTEELLEIEIGDITEDKCSSYNDTDKQNEISPETESEKIIEHIVDHKQNEKNGESDLSENRNDDSSKEVENIVSNSENGLPIGVSRPCKPRSISESNEEMNHSPSQKPRGILKLRKYSRSISESSDDFSLSSQEIITSPDTHIPEESSADESGFRVKKNVRFNEVVSRNLFRSNSSILGQRKKNQKKQRTKKKAAQRRMSESEGSETENEHCLTNQNASTTSSDCVTNLNHIVKEEESKVDNQQEIGMLKEHVNDNHEEKVSSCDIDKINANVNNESTTVLNQSVDNVGDTCDVLNESHSSNDENANKQPSSIENNHNVLEANTNKSKSKKKRRRKTKQGNESYEPRTMLSWDDGNSGENKEYTYPVVFANSMIFELD